MCNGWFDIIHPGHIALFRQAKEFCDYLIVAINHDASWHKDRQKLFTHDERKIILESIKYIDEVVIFNDPTPLSIINSRKIDIIFKGLDYENVEFSEKATLVQNGIEMMFLKTTDHHSTNLLDK